jgi:hypothetical protein
MKEVIVKVKQHCTKCTYLVGNVQQATHNQEEGEKDDHEHEHTGRKNKDNIT